MDRSNLPYPASSWSRPVVFRRWITLGLFLSCALTGALPDRVQQASASTPADHQAASKSQKHKKKNSEKLRPGRMQEAELDVDEADYYRIRLERGQFLSVQLEPRDINLTTTLLDPDDKQVAEVSNKADAGEPERLIAIAEVKGKYHLKVQGVGKGKSRGRYTIIVADLRTASEKDRKLIAAMQSFRDGIKLGKEAEQLREDADHLVKEQAAALRKQADEKYQAAISRYQESLKDAQVAEDRPGQARALDAIGIAWAELGDWKQAAEFYNRALPIWQGEKRARKTGLTLSRLGVAYSQTGNKEKALECYSQARQIWRAEHNTSGEAIDALVSVGILSAQAGRKPEAVEAFTEAVQTLREEKDPEKAAANLNRLASLFIRDIGDRQKAIEINTLALERWKAVSDQKKSQTGQGDTLRRLGFLNRQLDRKEQAVAFLEQSLRIWQKEENAAEEAYTLTEIGRVYELWGRLQEASGYLDQAQQRWQQARARAGQGKTLAPDDLFREANTLNELGGVRSALGKNQEALEAYQQAIDHYRELKEEVRAAIVLSNMGGVYLGMGDYQKAIGNYEESLEVFLKAGKTPGIRGNQAGLIINIGSVYESVGDKERALEYYERALKEYRDVMSNADVATSLHIIGRVYNSLGQPDKALRNLDEALAIFRKIDDPLGIANTLHDMSEVYFALGERQTDAGEQQRQKQKALETLKQALEIAQKMGNQSCIANFLSDIGSIYIALGERQQALASLGQSLPLRQAVGDRSGEARTRYHLARIQRDLGNTEAAGEQIQKAIELAESIRTRIVREELQAAYFRSVQDYYEFYIDLLMRMHKQRSSAGHDGAALHASERARARSLLDLLSEAGADIRQGVAPELLGRERELQGQLNSKAKEQDELLRGKNTTEQLVKISGEIDGLVTQLKDVRAKIRQTSPRYAQLTQPQPLGLAEIQRQVLDSETLLLEYALGKERSWLWAVTPTTIKSYELPPRAQIEEVANHFLELLTARQPQEGETEKERAARIAEAEVEMPKVAEQLSRMLLAPLAEQPGKQRLLIVGDGVLQTLPFGALPVPGQKPQSTARKGRKAPAEPQLLVVEHEIAYLPSASTLAVLRRETAGREPAPKQVAVVADPVFEKEDERLRHPLLKGIAETVSTQPGKTAEAGAGVTRALVPKRRKGAAPSLPDSRFPRLVGTRREAEAIMALAQAGARREALDFDASRATVTSADLGRYRYLHFATHGFLSDKYPELSGIVFSMVDEKGQPQDGFMRAHEIFNLNLPADLVVLSACQTGLGEEIRGEGLVGLTRAFMYAGAPRVVVSLWGVSDQATAELMKRFYAGMLAGEHLSPARALQAAQISMLREGRWKSPYYWAAFVLQGEWRRQ